MHRKGCLSVKALTEIVILVPGGPDPHLKILALPQQTQLELFSMNKKGINPTEWNSIKGHGVK